MCLYSTRNKRKLDRNMEGFFPGGRGESPEQITPSRTFFGVF